MAAQPTKRECAAESEPSRRTVPAVGVNSRCLVLIIAAAAGIAVAYGDTVLRLVRVWKQDPNYSHGFAVPVASLIFAWLALHNHQDWHPRSIPRGDVLRGAAGMAIGWVLHGVSFLIANLLLDVLSLVFLLRGMAMILGGQALNRRLGFPILFLLFMAPLPGAWYPMISITMQQLVARVSSTILESCGIAVFQEGHLVHLPGYTMRIGEACSGLRQLVTILALSVSIGQLSQRRAWFAWVLALASMPVAIVANCWRVTLSGAVLMMLGREWAEGVFHQLEGLAMVAVAGLLVACLAWTLARVDDRWSGLGAPAR